MTMLNRMCFPKKRLISKGKARWPNLPCWEGFQPPDEGELWELDGSDMTWIEPSGLVSLAVKSMRTGTRPHQVLLSRITETYVQRMGLHSLLGVIPPASFQSHPAGDRFSELRIIRPQMSPQECSDLCSQIARVMAQGERKEEDLFAYILGELTANVRQHAGRPGVVMAQAWPEDGAVEFAIGDWGIGIKAGLEENPQFRGVDDREALDLAIRPNTSGKDWAGAPSYGTRENSGNGLFTLSFLAQEGFGKFLLASGSQALFINGSRRHAKRLECPFPGTLASLRFSPGGIDLMSMLREASNSRGLATCQDDLHFE